MSFSSFVQRNTYRPPRVASDGQSASQLATDYSMSNFDKCHAEAWVPLNPQHAARTALSEVDESDHGQIRRFPKRPKQTAAGGVGRLVRVTVHGGELNANKTKFDHKMTRR
jgi:hypothetical protein